MTRRSLASTGLLASVVVVLVTVLSACTDPNVQVNDPHNAAQSTEHESRLAR